MRPLLCPGIARMTRSGKCLGSGRQCHSYKDDVNIFSLYTNFTTKEKWRRRPQSMDKKNVECNNGHCNGGESTENVHSSISVQSQNHFFSFFFVLNVVVAKKDWLTALWDIRVPKLLSLVPLKRRRRIWLMMTLNGGHFVPLNGLLKW